MGRLSGNEHLVTLHVVRLNPTKSAKDKAIKLSSTPFLTGQYTRSHNEVLLALNKGSDSADEVRQILREAWDAGHLPEHKGQGPEIVELQRGRIKGVNNAGDCTLALLTAMSTFTGIDDCALHAALQYKRTFPDTPHVFTPSGSPNWPGGKMLVPAMRTYYALKSLDEIYQAIWRTAVRNDRPVEAVVALPDQHWLAALYRTVMPDLVLGSAYLYKEGKETIVFNGKEIVFEWDFERDDKMDGFSQLHGMPSGWELAKKEVARVLGYKIEEGEEDLRWDKNKPVIMALLGDFYEKGSTVRMLRRKE